MTTTTHPSRVPFDTAKGFTWRSPREELQALEALDKVREAMHSELAKRAARGDVKPPRLDLFFNYYETSRGLNVWMSVRWFFSIFDLGQVKIEVPVEARLLCGPIRDFVLQDALGDWVAGQLGVTAKFDEELRAPSFKGWNLTLPVDAVEQGWGEFR